MRLNDADGSWEVYSLLESYSNGMGGWDIPGVLGKPLIELDESLVQDLTTWRWLRAIGEKQKREMDEQERKNRE